MRNKYLISLFITLMTMITVVISCADLQEDEVANAKHLKSMKLNDNRILDRETLLGNGIYLPEGTHWYYSNEDKNEVIFKLPEEYVFLLKNLKSGKQDFSIVGGYSCTCSERGSCTVIYNKDLGYGCLQSTCTGACEGKSSKHLVNDYEIVGVLNSKNTIIDADLTQKKASLSNDGIEVFFDNNKVQEEIKRTYDIIYKYSEKPNFELGSFDKEKFVLAKTILYGFEIGIIIPNDPDIKRVIPDLKMKIIEDEDTPTSCSCVENPKSGNCQLKTRKLLGYVVYYCNGCTTCSMN